MEPFLILACIFSLFSMSVINPLYLSALGIWEIECGVPAGFGVIWRWGSRQTDLRQKGSTFPNHCLHTRPFISTNKKTAFSSRWSFALLPWRHLELQLWTFAKQLVSPLLPVLSSIASLFLFATIIYQRGNKQSTFLINFSCGLVTYKKSVPFNLMLPMICVSLMCLSCVV